jgi:hypothetical protein
MDVFHSIHNLLLCDDQVIMDIPVVVNYSFCLQNVF